MLNNVEKPMSFPLYPGFVCVYEALPLYISFFITKALRVSLMIR